MNVKKFIAPTTSQALRDIHAELGGEAVILSNRKVAQGVEIIALANADIEQLTNKHQAPATQAVVPKTFIPKAIVAPSKAPAHEVETANVTHAKDQQRILGEIQNMHSMLQQQLSAMSWNDVQIRDPKRAVLLRRILSAGFSSVLARQLMSKMPANEWQGEAWIRQVLKRNLHVAGEADDVVANGGVYALMGPTGVGKTTTTAKLAARAVVRYGADKVALLTTDSYRIGAYEQLKIYGKILGVAVHAVKDTHDLQLTLTALRHKHLVLIDTVGMGQRDERVANQNEMFDTAGVRRLLLLNATCSGENLEEVATLYHAEKVIGCIATKLDEAVNPAAVLDVVIRHRLVMHYMANGQRVPEDLHPVNAEYLVHRAIKHTEKVTPFSVPELDFPVLMSGIAGAQLSGVAYAA